VRLRFLRPKPFCAMRAHARHCAARARKSAWLLTGTPAVCTPCVRFRHAFKHCIRVLTSTAPHIRPRSCTPSPAPAPTPYFARNSIKAFNDMAKAVKKARGMELTWNGGVMDGKFVKPADISKLESLPTKKQLIGQIAGGIKQVTTKIARANAGVALKMAYGVKAIADGKSELVKA
jgi:hypothetical protein